MAEVTAKPGSDVEMKDGERLALDLSTLDEDTKKIKATRQIEFYFADSNLPYDRFMWTLHSKTPEHWVPLKTVASFKRMRPFQSLGQPWLVESIKEKATSIEVDESGENIRRNSEVVEPEGVMERSVYAKGFPDEDETLQYRIEEFFSQYGNANQVRMRRTDDKAFKNSVFVEFTEIKSVFAFLQADPKPTFEGKELLTMSKEAYVQMKMKEKGITDNKSRSNKAGRAGGPKFNGFAEMKKAKFDKAKEAGSGPPKDVYLEFMGEKLLIHVAPKDANLSGSSLPDMPEGLQPGQGYVLPSEVPNTKNATLVFVIQTDEGEEVPDWQWNEIKTPLKALGEFGGKAPFIKSNKNEKRGLVSFHRKLEESDLDLVKKTVPKLGGKPIEWTFAEEDEEKEFQLERAQSGAKYALSASFELQRQQRSPSKSGRGGGRGRGDKRGRGGRGRGGRGGDRNAERAATAASAKESDDGQTGEKRKRGVEPDGGEQVGKRGEEMENPPAIASFTPATKDEPDSKKVKVDGES